MVPNTHQILTATVLALVPTLTTNTNAQVINENIKLLASDGAESDSFGHSNAISNGVIAVGAYIENQLGSFAGATYLFDTAGNELTKLLAKDGDAWHQFGIALDIDNGIVAIGANGYRDTTPYAIGAVYLFDADPLSPNFGNQIAKLTADDPAATTRFATAVSIKDGIVAVGAPWADGDSFNTGAVYIFDADPLSPNFGNQLAKLTANDGENRDRFGISVAIGNGIIAIGSNEDDHPGALQNVGSVYLFDQITHNQIAKILPDDPLVFDEFGNALAIDNGILAVGASKKDDEEIGSDVGAVYLFDLDTRNQLIKLTPFDGELIYLFGATVALDNNTVAVGATFGINENGFNSGAAYTYNADPLSEEFGTLIAKFTASDGNSYDFFGNALDVDNGILTIGADGNDDLGTSSGSAYIFNMNPPCPADFTNDGLLNFSDVSAFLDAFGSNNPTADFTNDGSYNFLDISAFLLTYAAGCP